MASDSITSWQIDGETMKTVINFIFFSSKITADGDCSHEIKTLAPSKKSYDQTGEHVKKQRDITWLTKVRLAKDVVFPIVMNECENWTIKKGGPFWNVVLEKTLESPLNCKEILPVNCKVNQSWIYVGRTDADTETPILWPPDAKNSLLGKDPDAGKDWRQEEKGTTEDEMVGWHHWLDGWEFEQALGVGDGQKNLACCSPWDWKESDMTEWLNWTDL